MQLPRQCSMSSIDEGAVSCRLGVLLRGVGVVVVLPGSVDQRVDPRKERSAFCWYSDGPGVEGGCGRSSRVVHVA